MQHTPNTDSYLAIARADAADRQRRAERYRQRRELGSPTGFDRRRTTITALVTGLVSIGIVALGPTATADEDRVPTTPAKPAVVEQPVTDGPQQGWSPGRPDGWFEPGTDPAPNRVPQNLR